MKAILKYIIEGKKTNPTERPSFSKFFQNFSFCLFFVLGIHCPYTCKILCIVSRGSLCQKYCQYWAENPQRAMPAWLGWGSREQTRAKAEHCPSFVGRFFESSIMSLNVLLCWLSHFWQTDAETGNLQPMYHHLIPSKAFEESALLPCGVSRGHTRQLLSLLAAS